MELVLPNNYAELEQEEMMYLDGGDAKNFAKNEEGLLYKIGINTATRAALGIPSNFEMMQWGYWTAVYYASALAVQLSSITANPAVITLVGLGAALMGAYLWENRVFY